MRHYGFEKVEKLSTRWAGGRDGHSGHASTQKDRCKRRGKRMERMIAKIMIAKIMEEEE